MLEHDYPILEFDASPDALIEPSRVLSPINIPRHCVLCFFQDVITGLREQGLLRVVHTLGSEMGPNPVYALDVGGRPLALMQPGIGAPLAGGFTDELIARTMGTVEHLRSVATGPQAAPVNLLEAGLFGNQ